MGKALPLYIGAGLAGFLINRAFSFVFVRLTKRFFTEEITISGTLFILLGAVAATLAAGAVLLLALLLLPSELPAESTPYLGASLFIGMALGALWSRFQFFRLRS